MGIPFSGSLRRKFPRAKRKRNQQLFNLTPGSEFLSFVGYLNLSFDTKENSELAVVRVEKKRYGFSVEGIICEYAQVWFNGAMVETACCESENYEGMKKATQALGISELPNTNYLKAAKQVLGMN